MKPLFQQRCEALVATLTEAKTDEDHILDMHTWVNDKHPCGTAACVCGYQAIMSDLSLFEIAKERAEQGCDGNYHNIAAAVSDDLHSSCVELFGNNYLAMSIYLSTDEERLSFAILSNVADEKTLETFKHLTSNNPSLDDAIEYIEFVIDKCKEKAA